MTLFRRARSYRSDPVSGPRRRRYFYTRGGFSASLLAEGLRVQVRQTRRSRGGGFSRGARAAVDAGLLSLTGGAG